MRALLHIAIPGLLAATALAGCSSDRLQCGSHGRLDPEGDRCIWRFQLSDGGDAGLDVRDSTVPDDTIDTFDPIDTHPPPPDSGLPPDGSPPICDHDGDGEPDPGIDCSFFAHSGSRLFKVDPVRNEIASQGSTNVPASSFLDMDIHPNGDLWGLTSSALYRRPKGTRAWQKAGELEGLSGANGMAIDRQGTAYLTMGNALYTVDLAETDAAIDPTQIGRLGGDYSSSGDCVIRTDGTLLMTSRNPAGPDILLEVDRQTARPTEIGVTDHRSIWGLTDGWNNLYGTTAGGELIVIDPTDGESRTLHHFPGVTFNGAASTPASRRRMP